MATRCIYNGVVIHDVLTEGITQQVQYDSTGRDAIFVRSVISCRGTIYTSESPTLPRDFGKSVSDTTGLGPALDNIMGRLMQPKKEFIYSIDRKKLFHVLPSSLPYATSGGVKDLNNGPRPSARWLNVIGNRSVTVQFSVEVATYLCDSNGGQPNGVTNYHFWVADEIDENWRTTRVFQGQLRVSTLLYSVHTFRALALPRLAPGFVRESISFNESQDGMTLDFTIRDAERYVVPPSPATKWQAHHALTFPHMGSDYAESEVRISLESDKDTPKSHLLDLAFKILKQKLHIADLRADGKNFVMSATLGDDMTDSGVEATARVMHMSPSEFTGARREFGKPLVLPGYSRNVFAHPRPTATLSGVFYQALNQDPCNAYSERVLKPLTNIDYFLDEKEPQPSSQKVTPDITPPTSQSLREQASLGYARYIINSSIDTRSGNVVLPIASSANSKKTSTVISLFPAQTTRTIRIEADRLNAWPTIPIIADFTDNNQIVNTLISHKPSLESMKISADGVKALYGLTGEFVYQLSRAPKSGESLPAGVPAYVTKNSPLIMQALSANYMFDPTSSKLA